MQSVESSQHRRRRRVSPERNEIEIELTCNFVSRSSSQPAVDLAPVVEIKVDDDRSDERSNSSNSNASLGRNDNREEVYSSASPSAGTSADSAKPAIQQPETSGSAAAVTPESLVKPSSSSSGSGGNNNLGNFPFGSPYGSHLFPLPHR